MPAEPLTPEEKKWARRLERVLMDCPKRIGLYTIGDRGLTLFDLPAYEVAEAANPTGSDGKERDMVDILARNQLDLGHVDSATLIHGVCG